LPLPGVGGGDGKLTVQDGGTVESDGSLDIVGHISDGAVTIDGTGSLWKSLGIITVGGSGAGTLTVENAGTVSSKGTSYSAVGQSAGASAKSQLMAPMRCGRTAGTIDRVGGHR
jgi:T5SS/PEP-CTERM-associated repeat protein